MTLSRLVFLGAPGAGKGTQAERACRDHGLVHLSTGDLLRSAVKQGTPSGVAAKGFMDKGELVPDEVVFGVLFERLDEGIDTFLLDGFPRNLAQAEGLDERLAEAGKPLDGVIELDVPSSVIVGRITGRRVCKACGATYHVEFRPTSEDGVCDACGGDTHQRSDDTEAVIAKRLEVYEEQTAPLKEYYERKGLLVVVNGDRPMDAVEASIDAALSEGERVDG